MGLGGLQHYTIEPQDLERTKDFYCDVLGLENGDRPPLDFPGYWLYSGGAATGHSFHVLSANGRTCPQYGSEVPAMFTAGSVAFFAFGRLRISDRSLAFPDCSTFAGLLSATKSLAPERFCEA